MDVIARLLGCAGQAADAESVKMKDAPNLLKIPKSECPDIWILLPRHIWQKLWSNIEGPVVPLGRKMYGHPLAGLLWERLFEEVLLELGWEKVSNWNVGKDCSHRYPWMISEWLEKQNMAPMWKNLMQLVDLDEPTSFLDDVALNVYVNRTRLLLKSTEKCSNQKFSAGATENLPGWEKHLTPRRLRGPTTWKDMLKNALRGYCDLANKKTEQLYKVSSPC